MRLLLFFSGLLVGVAASAQSPCINNTNSLNFNAASVNINSDVNLDPDTAITVEAWIRATAWSVNVFDGTIACKHSWSQGEQGYVLRAGGNGQVEFKIATSISWQGPVSPVGSMVLNTWYHVAGTYDGDSVKVYVNGIQQGSLYMPTGMIPGTAYPWRIGRLSDPSQTQTRFWSGQIDEVRIWNRALDASEILARYDHHLDPNQETGLAGYWRFNDGNGTTVVDETSNGNNGTLVGAAWSNMVPFNQTAATPVIFPNGLLLTSTITAVAYQWNLNGNPIPGANAISWTAQANGSYTVTITDSAGCTATSGPYIIASVGMEENTPVDYIIRRTGNTYTFRSNEGRMLNRMTVFNATLQQIESRVENGVEMQWNTDGIAPGVYFVLLTDTDNRTGHVKVLVR